MRKEKLINIFKDLAKVYLVYLIFDIVWPDADMRNISTQLFLQKNFIHFIKRGIPVYLSVKLFFFFKN